MSREQAVRAMTTRVDYAFTEQRGVEGKSPGFAFAVQSCASGRDDERTNAAFPK